MDFISELMFFVGAGFGIIIFAMAITFKFSIEAFKQWFNSEEGMGAYASAGLGISSICGLALVLYLVGFIIAPNAARANSFSDMFEGGTWLNDNSVYLGLDYTLKQSPQCKGSGVDDHGTSNLGFRQNIWQNANGRFRWNATYTHHSCFIGSDRNGYDGLGTNIEWFLYRKN
jgi:hypothetical protein